MQYRDIEGLLYNYKIIKERVKNLEEDFARVDDVYIQKSNGPADGMPRGTTTSKPTEQIAEVIIEEKSRIKEQIRKDKNKLHKIDGALNALKREEKEIIILKYIEGYFWADVAAETCFSISHVKRIRRNAINKMLEVLN